MKNLKNLGKVLDKNTQKNIFGGGFGINTDLNQCYGGDDYLACSTAIVSAGCCLNGNCVALPSMYNNCIQWRDRIYSK